MAGVPPRDRRIELADKEGLSHKPNPNTTLISVLDNYGHDSLSARQLHPTRARHGWATDTQLLEIGSYGTAPGSPPAIKYADHQIRYSDMNCVSKYSTCAVNIR
jgi:hypothetical protein